MIETTDTMLPKHRLAAVMAVLAAAAIAVITLAGGGCDRSPAETNTGPDPSGGPYEVVCTVGMVADIVREVAGDRARVSNIIGEGVDPHLYKPTRADVRRLQDADLVFYAGLMLEGKMADALVKVARSGKPVYAVTELIDETYLLEPPALQGHYDPHIWMDVRGWMKAVRAVAESMAEVDPDHAEAYAERADAYLVGLEELDAYVRDAIASIPASRRVIVTAHDAFSYFGRAYGIEVLGIQGISTESEAGLDHINALVDRIVGDRVPAVFVESSVADKNIRALVEGARSRGHEVHIGGTLFSDAMGQPGTYEGTYLGMIDHNATIITRSLGGTAPPAGMHDRLTPAGGDDDAS